MRIFHDWIRSVADLPFMPTRRSSATSAIAPGWRSALILIGAASLVFAVAFRRDISRAVSVWIDSTAYNHCFLILPLVGFLVWLLFRMEWDETADRLRNELPATLPISMQGWEPIPTGRIERLEAFDRESGDLIVFWRVPCRRHG